MDVVMLAAGYGTRLQRDLTAEKDKFGHLLDIPKALLPLQGKPLIDYWLEDIASCATTERLCVAVNRHYAPRFIEWAKTASESILSIEIVSNESLTNDDRLGSVADLSRVISSCSLGSKKPVVVLAGDTLFYKDVTLASLIHAYESQVPFTSNGQKPILLTCYQVQEVNQVRSSGILELDSSGSGQVIRFLEKPDPTDTMSRLACPCFYILPPESLPFLELFLKEKESKPLPKKDAAGTWIAWLVGKYPIKAVKISGRLDIGGLESYLAADKYLASVLT